MTSPSQPRITRRALLSAIGVAGGAGVLFATMEALGLAPGPGRPEAVFRAPRRSDFTLTGRAAKRVIILGGGIAGLATAYELGKAGYDCVVLEARDVAGGRNFTVRTGVSQTDLDGHTQRASFSEGIYLNAGPARIAQWMVTLDYCRELGVPVEVFVNSNANAYIYNESAGMQPGKPVRYRTGRADMHGYVAELLAKATDQGALDQVLTNEDKERLLSFLESWGDIGGRREGYAYTGTSFRGFLVDPGAGNVAGTVLGPPPSLSEVLASGVGRYFSFEFEYDQAMPMFQPVGGMDRIVAALVSAVGDHRIELGAAVTNVTTTDSGVTVRYTRQGRTQQVTGDYCVATLPPHIMARVPHNLGPEVSAALADFPTVAAGKLGLEYRSRWWETDHKIFGGITETDLDLHHVWYPSYGYLGERGLIVGYYNTGAAAEAYGALSPAERTARAVAQGVKIHGAKYRTELDASFSVAWHRTPHIEAAWTLPKYTSSGYQLLLQPAGRVYFAGDWLSHAVAWQHGAFMSARATVTALHERVMAE